MDRSARPPTSSYMTPASVGPTKLPSAKTDVQRPDTTVLVVALRG